MTGHLGWAPSPNDTKLNMLKKPKIRSLFRYYVGLYFTCTTNHHLNFRIESYIFILKINIKTNLSLLFFINHLFYLL